MSDGAAEVGVLDVVPDAPDAPDGDASDCEETAFGVLDAVRDSIDVCSAPTGDRTAAEWMALVAECGRAMTALSGARDAAMVRLAAIDEVVDEDGVVSEQVNGLGTVCVDAGSMVATATGCSPGFAEELVDQAVLRVVRVPALHEAMLAGLLDDYSARCIASELTDAPVDIARAVVDALAKDFGVRSGPALRRRTRELLFRMAPELLRKRIVGARKKIGLRRWVGEPGTDQWDGTFASERAATAWAAVDALARQYRTEDTYPTLETARAYALLDLVHGNASVKTVLSLTAPAGEVGDADSAAGESPRAGKHAAAGAPRSRRRASAESMSGQVGRPRTRTNRSTETDSKEAASVGMQSRDSRDAASHDDAGARLDDGNGDSGPADGGGRFVAVSGAQGSSLTWVPVWALPLPGEPACGRSTTRACDPVSGALIDPDDALATEAYRPGERLKRFIRARDGHCRFPGCTVPARSCDIDHVQAWPRGPTSAANLMCLCRRHHRVKQRMRWRVFIDVDATVTWTDPAGAVHITEPVDHIGVREVRGIWLRDADVAADRDEPKPCKLSVVETVLGVLAEHPVAAVARDVRALRRHRRMGSRCGYADTHPSVDGSSVVVELSDEERDGYRSCCDARDTGPQVRIAPAPVEDSPPF